MYIDSHCHLDFPDLLENLDDHLASMAANGVSKALCAAVNLEDFPRIQALVAAHDCLVASVGVHPEYTEVQEADVATLTALAADPKIVAIGETGLDYHWHPERPEWQRQRFSTHIEAAKETGLPLIVHVRDAADDAFALLKTVGEGSVRGVMHCFTGSQDNAEKALELGFHISFSGIVTFRNAKALQAVAKTIPSDRLLIETDAPYLAPVPHRGKRNEPAFVRHVAEGLAELRGTTSEEIGTITSNNFRSLFAC